MLLSNKIFSNFKSLWHTFLRWQYCTAVTIYLKNLQASSSFNLLFFSTYSNNSPLVISSVAKYMFFGVSKISNNLTTFGLFSNFSTWISLITRLKSYSHFIFSFSMIFTATYSPLTIFLASRISPNIPLPSCLPRI